ncbi:MAG: thiamine pyrophosphate-binding protein [Steroidobacteraceae bacterium]
MNRDASTAAAAIVEALVVNGIDTVFGLPGGQLYDLFEALRSHSDRLRVVTSRHEQGAAYMAYGYAHSTGRIGVFTIVPGPGVLNASAALLTAYGCNSRVLCIAGEIPQAGIGRGVGYLHELPDQVGLMRHVTKWARHIDRPADTAAVMSEAFRQLHDGRPRPVAVDMSMDTMAERVDLPPATRVTPGPLPAGDPDALARAALLLGKAKRPVIVVGGGAADAAEEVRELAEMLQAPVTSFRQGRGILSDRHYLAQTYPAGNRLWKDADAALLVGTRGKYPLMYWGTSGLDIVRIDIDPAQIEQLGRPAIGIVADAARALRSLIEQIPGHNRKRDSLREEMLALKASLEQQFASIEPQYSYLKVIRECLPEDGIFVDEVTQVGFASWYMLPVYRPRQLISSGYQGNLGYGYATALGVQIANPERKVLQISGDGGLMYNIQELSTAVANRVPLTTVVFRDDFFGNVRRDQTRHFGADHTFAVELRNPDFVQLAESFGAQGLRARNPVELREAILRGFAYDGPTLIEVPTGAMASPWPFIQLPAVRGT